MDKTLKLSLFIAILSILLVGCVDDCQRNGVDEDYIVISVKSYVGGGVNSPVCVFETDKGDISTSGYNNCNSFKGDHFQKTWTIYGNCDNKKYYQMVKV